MKTETAAAVKIRPRQSFDSGRDCAGLPGVEEMVGLFINTLPLRLMMEPETGLLDWLARVQEELTELRQYEHTPLVQVQEWSGTGRGVPLFDTIVAF